MTDWAKKLEQTLLDEFRGDVEKAFKELCRRYAYLVIREGTPPPGPAHEPTQPGLFDLTRDG